jgi:hypothetical protein
MAKPTDEPGWQTPKIVDGMGIISMPSATEAKPCYLCKSWDKDVRKLVEYVTAHGMVVGLDGCYVFAAISAEFPARQQFKIDPTHTGFCRNLCVLSLDEATCEHWKQRETREDMRGLIR